MNQTTDIIKKKFDELGYSSFYSPPVPKNVTALIRGFQEVNSFELPEEYKYFLEHYGECNFEKDAIFKPSVRTPFDNSQGFQELSFFYGIGTEYSIYKMSETYCQRVPQGFVPIAELPGGNQLCIDLNSDSSNFGKIYLWDHENECDGGLDNTYLVANSFSDFINSFKEEKKTASEDDDIESFRFDF